MKSKKGMTHEQVFLLIQVVLIMGVIAGLYIAADRIVNDTYFKRAILSKDISFTMNSMSSSPGNIDFLYRPGMNITNFDICFVENLNQVRISDHEQISYAYYSYFLPSYYVNQFGMPSDNCIVYSSEFSLNKTGGNFYIWQKISESEKQKFSCRQFLTKIDSAKILIDPLKGYDSTGDLNQKRSTSSYQLNNLIANSLKEMLSSSVNLEIVSTREDGGHSLTKEERIEKNSQNSANITISIDSSSNQDYDYVFIYFNPDSEKSDISSKLACIIANRISQDTDFQVLILPILPDSVYTEDYKKSLAYENINLFIEVGSITNEETQIFEDYIKISQAVSNGIKEYTE